MSNLEHFLIDEPPQTSKFIVRVLKNGRVPSKLGKHFYRSNAINKLSKEILEILNESTCQWLVVHGMPGCGKTCLVSDTLRFSPEILGHFYDRVIWLTDRTREVSKLSNIFINALVMLRVGQNSPKNYPEDNFDFLRNEILDELKCNSRVLFVVDEVYLSECIRFFYDLPCSIIWVTSNKEIFNWLHLESKCKFYNLDDDEYFSITEINTLSKLYDLELNSNHLFELAKISGGNAALLEKFFRLAQGQNEIVPALLHRLKTDGLNTLNSTTSYQYQSLIIPLKNLFTLDGMPEHVIQSLENLIVFPINIWFNMEILSLIWPLDLCGHETDELINGLIHTDLNFLVNRSLIIWKEKTNLYAKEKKFYGLHPIVYVFLTKNYFTNKKRIGHTAKIILNRLQYEVRERARKNQRLSQPNSLSQNQECTFEEHFPFEHTNIEKMSIKEFYFLVKNHLQRVIKNGAYYMAVEYHEYFKKWFFGWL